MTWLKRKKRAAELPRQLALGLLEDAMGEAQSQEKPAPRPLAGQCEKVKTFSGEVAHYRHPDLGVICQEMAGWPLAAWFPAPDSMRVHAGCLRAARAQDEKAAS